MTAGLSRGLTLSDFDNLTLGQVIDYIIVYDNQNMTEEDKENEVRMATQADFDKF